MVADRRSSFGTVGFLMCRLSVFRCQSLSAIVVLLAAVCRVSVVGCSVFAVKHNFACQRPALYV